MLPEGRLKDYYRNFIIYHEKVIQNFETKNYADMPMREAVTALCKALFHEVLPDADTFYVNGGSKGNRFSLSNTNSTNGIVFFFSGNVAGRKSVSDSSRAGHVPCGEILQIGTALAATLNYGPNDARYTAFKRVQDTVHQYESNDKHHVCSDIDKAKYTLTGRINDYESFVHYILISFDQFLHVKLSEQISSATKTDFGVLKQSEEEMRLLANDTTSSLIDKLNEELNSLYPSPFVLFSPANVDCRLSHGLARIPWNLIVTFDPNGEEENHLISIIRKEWEGIRPFKIGTAEGDGRDETIVIFANGNSVNESKSKYKEWTSSYKNKVESALNMIRKGSERVVAVCLTDRFDNRIFNKGGIGLLKSDDSAVIIGKIGSNLEEGLNEDFSIEEYQIFDITELQCAYAFHEIDIHGMSSKITVSSNLSNEDMMRYAAHGIKIICPILSGTEKEINPISSFFSGKEITEKDLYNDYDVRRDFYERFLRTIEVRLDNGIRFTHYLKQTPSSGATTVGMRLAYDITMLSERGHFKTPVTTIFISELKSESVNPMVERIKDLALKVSPNQILAFIDRSIQSNDFERMKESLIDGGSLKISFIRISEKEKGKPEYTSSIDDVLKKSELPDFVKAYRRHAIAMSDEGSSDWNSLKHVIEFPLSLGYADSKNLDIKEYVDNVLRMFSETNKLLVQKIFALIAFTSQYIVNTDNYVESFLFNGEIGKRFTDWYKDDLTAIERKAFERLIKFEEGGEIGRQRTGRVKTRFSKSNQDIIKISNLSLYELAISYIEIFFSESGSTDGLLNNYIINLFFKKEEYEDDNSGYTGKSENQKFYKKLSSVFNDIHKPDSIELIIEELGKYIGDNPRFLIAKAQFNYNRAYFIDSEEHDAKIFDNARDILEKLLDETEWSQDNESIILQSLGVLNFRRLGALRKIPNKNNTLITIAKRYIEDAVKYCDRAYSANPYDTHALVTKAQSLKSFLNFTRNILGYDENDFKFCETDEYLEWTSQYESTLETLSRFIVNIDNRNTTVSQNQLLSIYDELRSFAFKLIGQSQEYIYDLYQKKLSSRNIGNDLKKIYANRLFTVLVDAPNNEIRNGKIGSLSDEKLYFIEQQLVSSIRLGNLTGYEKIFRLHLFNSRKKYELTKEIQWLKDWIDKDKSPLSQLWGNYFISVLYSSELLLFGFDQKGFLKSAQEYFKESQKLAGILKYSDAKEFFYFKNAQGLQCVTENSNNATFVEGYIKKIRNNRQGIAMLDCGLEATFSPKGEFLMEDADKQTRIRAKVGFRFSGLGLYGLEIIDNKDTMKSKKIYNSQPANQKPDRRKDPLPSDKTGEQSLTMGSSIPLNPFVNTEDIEKDELEEGYDYYGIYHKDKYSGETITGDWKEHWIKYLTIEGPIDDVYDGDEVTFAVKKKINPDNGDEKWVAYDVRLIGE